MKNKILIINLLILSAICSLRAGEELDVSELLGLYDSEIPSDSENSYYQEQDQQNVSKLAGLEQPDITDLLRAYGFDVGDVDENQAGQIDLALQFMDQNDFAAKFHTCVPLVDEEGEQIACV